MNNYNNNINELCQIILEDQFPKEVSSVALEMLTMGPSSIQELAKKINFDFLSIRNAIIILIQTKLTTFQDFKRKDTREFLYELDIESILNILRYPKILYFINQKYGPNSVMIFEEFMQYGILSFHQCIEQIKYKLNKNNLNNQLRCLFITLIENNYLIQTNKLKNEEVYPKGNKRKSV
jgi:hypothetical protein